jgi:hypothetical protein
VDEGGVVEHGPRLRRGVDVTPAAAVPAAAPAAGAVRGSVTLQDCKSAVPTSTSRAARVPAVCSSRSSSSSSRPPSGLTAAACPRVFLAALPQPPPAARARCAAFNRQHHLMGRCYCGEGGNLGAGRCGGLREAALGGEEHCDRGNLDPREHPRDDEADL